MPGFEHYQEDNGANNLVIQHALRRVDTQVLGTALAGLSRPARDMFYRNMASAVVEACESAIGRMGAAAEAKSGNAQAVLLGLLEEAAERLEGQELPGDPSPAPEVDLATEQGIVATFTALAAFA